ncbi:MAG TPA: hypothetical protein VGM67_19435 [Gemmatimonadaceae bacterium]
MPTQKAHRVQRARRIIAAAYGSGRVKEALRFELLGDAVAVAVVKPSRSTAAVHVKVARALPNGRATRMLKECRKGFASVRDQIEYFESLHQRYGDPG